MRSPIDELAEVLENLPSVGEKTASRLAYFFVKQPKSFIDKFCNTLQAVHSAVKHCKVCCSYSATEICEICSSPKRSSTSIVVVATTEDQRAFEEAHAHAGHYHVLQGLIDPMNGIGPNNIRVKELLKHISEDTQEVILGMEDSVEGMATCLHIKQLLKSTHPTIKLSIIGFGLSSGSGISNADTVTLGKALENRKDY